MDDTSFQDLEARGEDAVQQVKTALSKVDLEGVAGSIDRAVKNVARQLGLSKREPSPYIVRERDIERRAAGRGIGGTVSLLAALGLGGVGLTAAAVSLAPLLVGVTLAGAAGCAVWGAFRLRSARRERELGELMSRMSDSLGERESIGLSELAQLVDVPLDKLEPLLSTAIGRGLIPEGHVTGSSRKRTLYLTDRSWEDDLEARSRPTAREERPASEDAPADESAEDAEFEELPADAAEVVRSGASFASDVLVARSGIADEEVRASLDGIVSKVQTLVSYVCKHPETASQLRKMTSYYLPTTAKLAASYAELEGRGGEQARSTREELKQTLELVDSALAKFSEDLLQEQSWDLKSDMDVMRTMLEQDGLA